MPKKATRRTSRSAGSRKAAAPAKSGSRPARRRAAAGDRQFSAHFRLAQPEYLERARTALRQAGIEVILETAGGGLVVAADRSQVEGFVDATLKETRVSRQVNRCQASLVRRSYAERDSADAPPTDADALGSFIFPVPYSYWQGPSAYPPQVPYYHLHPARDLARLFGVEALHARGVRGQGVRVAMIDSGFYRHPYYADPGIHNGTVPDVTTHAVLPDSDPETDDVGHGTGIAANVFALAPECEFHHFKDDNDPLAAMALARSLDPQVITCSWGWSEGYVSDVFTNTPNSGAADYLHDLETEIAAAVGDGIVVLFASGNGPEPGSWPSSAPGVISVGGALVTEDLELTASSYATSFVSQVHAGRSCPDVCGLVGPSPSGLLFALPTQPDNELDGLFSAVDGTQAGDGWLIASGTSSATPQLAGLSALLLQLDGGLSPAEVLDRLREMAVGVHQGRSASGHLATFARPNLATGHGWATFRRPHRREGYTGLY